MLGNFVRSDIRLAIKELITRAKGKHINVEGYGFTTSNK